MIINATNSQNIFSNSRTFFKQRTHQSRGSITDEKIRAGLQKIKEEESAAETIGEEKEKENARMFLHYGRSSHVALMKSRESSRLANDYDKHIEELESLLEDGLGRVFCLNKKIGIWLQHNYNKYIIRVE